MSYEIISLRLLEQLKKEVPKKDFSDLDILFQYDGANLNAVIDFAWHESIAIDKSLYEACCQYFDNDDSDDQLSKQMLSDLVS